MKRLLIVSVICIALIVPGISHADNYARDYIPAPPGCLALLLYYLHVSADSLYHDGHKVADGLDLNENIGLFRPIYFMEVGPFIIDPQMLIPFGQAQFDDNKADHDQLSASGMGDPTVLATFWFIHDTKSKTWLGFSPYFTFPIGDYDNNGALSLGANRFAFKEELGFVKGFEVLPGHNAYFDLTLAGDFFMDNDEFGSHDQTLSQDPILTVESHLSYDVTQALFLSADYYYHWGGETSVNGIDGHDEQSTHTVGMTMGLNIVPSVQVLFQYKGDVDVDNGFAAQVFTFRFLYACDVGYLFGSPAAAK